MKHRMCLIGAVLSIMALIIGCHPKEERLPLFKDAALQDSLQCFFDRIDSIANPYGAPSLFSVSLYIYRQDSLVRFAANAGLWVRELDTLKAHSDIFPHWIGQYRYGDKHILVDADWDPSEIINMSVLEPCDDIVERCSDWDQGCNLGFYWDNSEKTYLFKSPSTIILKRRRIGTSDPDYKGSPKRIDY